MEMVDASDNECCIEGCKIKRSKHQLPSYLYTSNAPTLKVTNIKNQPLANAPVDCIEDNIKFMPGYKNKQVWDIINGYLFLFNSKAEMIQTEAIWANPLDLLFIQKCSGGNCLQDSKDLIQVDETMLYDMFNIVVNSLNPSLQIPVDATGDNSEKS